MLKYSLMSQNPESFTCESTSEPAPVASTNSSACVPGVAAAMGATMPALVVIATVAERGHRRSEEHTSELQSHLNLVCRLLLEKKKRSRLNSILGVLATAGARI